MASIQKRGKAYRVTVCNGYTSDGKKITHSKTFKPDLKKTEKQNEKALKEFVLQFECSIKEAAYLDGDMTLRAFSQKWLAECIKPSKAATTYNNYKMNLETHILPVLGSKTLSEIKPVHIQRFCNSLIVKGRADGRSGALSTGTIKKVMAVLSSLFHRAVIWQLIEKNPCVNVELPTVSSSMSYECDISDMEQMEGLLFSSGMMEEKCFSMEQTKEFLKLLEASSLTFQIKVFLKLAVFSGCRRGELLALTWKDVDFDQSCIRIYKSVVMVKGKVLLKTPKNRSSVRLISLPESIMALLQKLKAEQMTHAQELGQSWIGKIGDKYDYNFLFTQWNGALIYPTTPYSDLKKLLRNQNSMQLPDITLHGLRHTNATLLIAENIDIKTVSERLGHAQTSTTVNIYAHSLKKNQQKASAALEQALLDGNAS